MGILQWFETDVKIPAGSTYEHPCTGGTNIVQIINRRAQGGGNVYADTRSSVKADYHLLKVDQGKSGTITHPKQIDRVYLLSDAATDLYVTVLEIFATQLDVVYNAAQIVQLSGAISVQSMPNVTVTSMPEVEVKNDAGNPLAVAGTVNIGTIPEVEIKNDVGNPLSIVPVPVGIHANGAAAAVLGANAAGNTVDVSNAPFVSAFGTANAATDILIEVSQNGVAWYDSGIKQTLAGAGDFFLNLSTGAKFARIKTSAAATVTATIAGK